MNATDIDVLRAFYLGNRRQLFTYAVSITGNREAAEDAIQSVFEKLLRRSGLPADLRPYVFRSVRNAALDGWRRARTQADSIVAGAAAGEPADGGPSAGFPPDDLGPLLQQLSRDEREAILLKIYGDLTFQEIADLRRVPLSTASTWYARGLEHLKSLLSAEFQ